MQLKLNQVLLILQLIPFSLTSELFYAYCLLKAIENYFLRKYWPVIGCSPKEAS